MEDQLDRLSRGLAEDMPRRRALKLMGATLGGAILALATAGRAGAAPRECTQCLYGTGQPCNVKTARSIICVEGTGPCPSTNNNGLRLCGTTTFHCPRGCPA